jgi:3-phenylpropionate/trans-cinnamate dioxygenase ferredoxin subunit
MASHTVARVGEIAPGQRKLVELEGRAIGVFNVNGAFYALRSSCPHQQAPLCQGQIIGLLTASDQQTLQLTRPGEIIRCPWHGWEFDITTGRSVFNPHRVRVRAYAVTVEADEEEPSLETYPVTVERGRIVVHL